MKFVQLIFLIVVSVALQTAALKTDQDVPLPDDFGLNIAQFLEKYGYPFESHEVETEDHYLLTMHRIPHGRNEVVHDDDKPKPAVLLMHGLLSSSMDWVNMGIDKALALRLADKGYDVWLGNARGNTWSRKHATLDPDNNATFWDFSFHEIGYFDLPAKIDYILKNTTLDQISYIGHSQGTTTYILMAASRPEYNDKIKVMAALAPVAYVINATSPIVAILAKYELYIDIVLNLLNINEFFRYSEIITEIGKDLCNDESELQPLCADVLFLFGGFGSTELNNSFIPVIASNDPSGASVKQIRHYLQLYTSGYFRQYDYGIIENFVKYGEASPPSYNISEITTPMALYYAQKNDFFAPVANVDRLASELQNVVVKHPIENENFNHIDFLWAIHINELLNDNIVKLIDDYNK